MPLILIGEEREAHSWSAEEFKSAVRGYMESIGYAQTVDSLVEGTVEDMVFVPAVPIGLPDARAEVKDTDLSLGDLDLRKEVGHHLKQWLAQPLSRRFDFYIFARSLRNLSKWRTIFRESSKEAITEFLPLYGEGADLQLADLVDAHLPDVLTFFSRTYVIRGTVERLRLAAAEKEAASLGSKSRWTEELRKRMDRRVTVDSVKDILVANLVMVRFPQPLAIVDTNAGYLEDVVDVLGIEATPPCRMLSKRKLLTFSSAETLDALTPIRTGTHQNTSVDRTVIEFPGAVESLVHQYIGKVALAKGARFDEDQFYFPARSKGRKLQKFLVPGVNDKPVSLADPKFLKLRAPDLTDGLASHSKSARLNFVVHSGFRFRVEWIWGGLFVAFIPHRIYTGDGIHRVDSRSAIRIDRHFRDPRYNRASAQLTKLQGMVDYLFSRHSLWSGHAPFWYGALKLEYPELGPNPKEVARSLVRIQTHWRPVPAARGESSLLEVSEESEDLNET